MGIVDSATGDEKNYSVEELKQIANELRGYIVLAIHAAGSGHPGGSLSAIDMITAAYFNKFKHDPKNPCWAERDRFIISKAHIVPAFYAALGKAGYFPLKEMMTLRKLGSPFQGHSDRLKCSDFGIEMSGGSLGQGLGVAVGTALAAKTRGEKHRVYVMMGDGEQQEGSIWEAVMSAHQFKLDNLVAIVDKNDLQIDGKVADVMGIEPIADKYRAFGWHVIEIDGHDMEQILKAFEEAENTKSKPSVIIAKTIKGKGVSFMENQAGWHGNAPNREQLDQALNDLKLDLPVEELLSFAQEFGEQAKKKARENLPKFSQNYWWNETDNMKTEMEPTRFGFGKALNEFGDDERLCTIQADISGSIKIADFEKNHPERLKRVFSVGIAEQNMMQVAAGLAKEGFIPITGTYGVFASGRPWDQIRTTICYSNLNVKIGGAHGGISVGPDGATHQSLEEIALMSILPNMHLFVPCDSLETFKATKASIFDIQGPCYVRFGRVPVPIITKPDTPFKVGEANVMRFRGEKENFVDAFESKPSTEYADEKEDLTIIACGAMVAEALRAAWILKKEFGLETRVIDMHSVKPLDRQAIIKAAKETQAVLTVEEHQVGGLGNLVAGAIAKEKDFKDEFVLDMIGINDRFGESGSPWQLTQAFGLAAESIADKAKALVEKKKK
jgi:transketolase